jgi:hypothetical protein
MEEVTMIMAPVMRLSVAMARVAKMIKEYFVKCPSEAIRSVSNHGLEAWEVILKFRFGVTHFVRNLSPNYSM